MSPYKKGILSKKNMVSAIHQALAESKRRGGRTLPTPGRPGRPKGGSSRDVPAHASSPYGAASLNGYPDGKESATAIFTSDNIASWPADTAGERGLMINPWVDEYTIASPTSGFSGTWVNTAAHPDNANIETLYAKLRPISGFVEVTMNPGLSEKEPVVVCGVVPGGTLTTALSTFSACANLQQVNGEQMASFTGAPGKKVVIMWRPGSSTDHDYRASTVTGGNASFSDSSALCSKFLIAISKATASVQVVNLRVVMNYEVTVATAYSGHFHVAARLANRAVCDEFDNSLKKSRTVVEDGSAAEACVILGSLSAGLASKNPAMVLSSFLRLAGNKRFQSFVATAVSHFR